jgi:hypothetical protein
MIYTHEPNREVVSAQMLQIFSFLRQVLWLGSARDKVAMLGMFCGSAYHAWPHQSPP